MRFYNNTNNNNNNNNNNNSHIQKGTLKWANGHMGACKWCAGRATGSYPLAGWSGLKWTAMSWNWCELFGQDGCMLDLQAGNHRFEVGVCCTPIPRHCCPFQPTPASRSLPAAFPAHHSHAPI